MEIEREAMIEAAVSGAAVVAFVALIVAIGATYGSTLAGQGAFALIGAIVLFVLTMAGIGYWLPGRE